MTWRGSVGTDAAVSRSSETVSLSFDPQRTRRPVLQSSREIVPISGAVIGRLDLPLPERAQAFL